MVEKNSIIYKFIISVSTVFIISSFLSFSLIYAGVNRIFNNDFIRVGTTIIETLSSACYIGVQTQDYFLLDSPVSGVYKQDFVAYVEVLNSNGNALIKKTKLPVSIDLNIPDKVTDEVFISHKESPGGETIYEFLLPVKGSFSNIYGAADEIIGWIRVGLYPVILKEAKESMFLTGMILIVTILFLSIITIIILFKNISKPLVNIEKTFMRAATGDFDVDIDDSVLLRHDEVGNLSKSFKVMLSKIKDMIQEIKDSEEELQQVQKMEAIGTLAAGIAHEINTPIQFIGDNTCFLEDQFGIVIQKIIEIKNICDVGFSKENIEYLKSLISSIDINFLQEEVPGAFNDNKTGIKKVAKIVSAMRSFSHVTSDTVEEANIRDAIDTVVIITRNEWKYHADINVDLPEEALLFPCYVNDLQQVLINLIVNATHAIEELNKINNREKGEILISASIAEDLLITVRDNGKGIPVEIKEKVYDPFFTTKEVGKGTGQGLALAYKTVVVKHGGKIWFESELNKGTTFFIKIPRTQE